MLKKNQKIAAGGKKNSVITFFVILTFIGICVQVGYTWLEFKKIKAQVADSRNMAPTSSSVMTNDSVIPLYIPMETFTVSLKPENGSENGDNVLYIGLTLQVPDNNSKMIFEKHLPEVRSRLLMLFSQQTASELSTDEGKQQLIDKVKKTISEPLAGGQRARVIDVLFNAFILR